MKYLNPRPIALFAVLSALCIGIQLAPRFPSIGFTPLLVFLAGAIFGRLKGAIFGASVMFINGFLSPWGFAGMILPFQMAGMTIVGAAGGIYGQTRKDIYTRETSLETAVLGAILTIIYDLITNFGYAILYLYPSLPLLPAVITAIGFGAPFTLVAVISNCVIFSIVFFPMVKTIQQFLGGESIWRKKSLPI